ncbi:MAG: hypothetical protein WDW36_003364 [Sanguina aurantia]
MSMRKSRSTMQPRCCRHLSQPQIFWDMDNCPFNDAFPGPPMHSPAWGSASMMSPTEHYDLLVQVFVRWCGVHPHDFKIHAVMAQTSKDWLCDNMKINMHLHYKRVNLQTPPGDGGFLPIIKTAASCENVQVMQLSPTRGTNGAYFEDCPVRWRCDWGEFLATHKGQQPPSTFIPADQFSPAHLIHHPDTDPDGSEAPNHRGFLAVESHSPERQRIGGLLYQQVSKLNPDIPGKITGLLTERMGDEELVYLLCNKSELLKEVENIEIDMQIETLYDPVASKRVPLPSKSGQVDGAGRRQLPRFLSDLLTEMNASSVPTIFDLGGGGVLFDCTISACITASNVTLRNGTILTVENTDESGPSLSVQGGNVTFEGMEILGGQTGVCVRPGGSLILRSCTLQGMQCGIRVGAERSDSSSESPVQPATLKAYQVKLLDFTGPGVLLFHGGDVTLCDCEISGGSNPAAACIQVTGQGCSAQATRVLCKDNKGRAMICTSGGRGCMTECVIAKNASGSVYVQGAGSVVEMEACTVDALPTIGAGGRLVKKYEGPVSHMRNVTIRNGTIIIASSSTQTDPMFVVTGTSVTFEDIVISGGRRALWVKPGSSVTMNHCTLRNARNCLMVGLDRKSDATATFLANDLTISGFTNTGLSLEKAGHMRLTDCTITGGAARAPSTLAACVNGLDSRLQATRLRVVNNLGRGLLCFNGGGAELIESTFFGNGNVLYTNAEYYDVCVEHVDSLVELTLCELERPPVLREGGDLESSSTTVGLALDTNIEHPSSSLDVQQRGDATGGASLAATDNRSVQASLLPTPAPDPASTDAARATITTVVDENGLDTPTVDNNRAVVDEEADVPASATAPNCAATTMPPSGLAPTDKSLWYPDIMKYLSKGSGTTGLWAEELASPYYVFKNAGYDVKIVSVAGGKIPFDEGSLAPPFLTPEVEKFLVDLTAMREVADSPAVSASMTGHDAIYLPGGHGAVWDFPDNTTLISLLEAYHKAGKVVSSVCHGVAGLLNVKDEGGTPILKGKQATGFSNSEEAAVGKDKLVPFLLETEMKAKGAEYSSGADWSVHAVADGRLITGQNPQSSARVAELVVQALKLA